MYIIIIYFIVLKKINSISFIARITFLMI